MPRMYCPWNREKFQDSKTFLSLKGITSTKARERRTRRRRWWWRNLRIKRNSQPQIHKRTPNPIQFKTEFQISKIHYTKLSWIFQNLTKDATNLLHETKLNFPKSNERCNKSRVFQQENQMEKRKHLDLIFKLERSYPPADQSKLPPEFNEKLLNISTRIREIYGFQRFSKREIINRKAERSISRA